MPKAVEDLVSKLLAQDDFYPEKTPDERKSLAYAIANKQLSSFELVQVNAPTQLSIEASGDGSLLVFKHAILAQSETNKNGDEIPPEEIDNLANTISGKAVDIEHNRRMNCGAFTAGRTIDFEGGAALSVDGFIWADRFPDEAQGIQDGTRHLSVEADMTSAECSKCGKSFSEMDDYCSHLLNRKSSGARRKVHGLKAAGGGVVKRPAGSKTKFDRAQLYLVAHELDGAWYDSLLPEGESIDDLPASDFADPEGRRFPYKIHGKVNERGWHAAWSAAHGGHTGKSDESAIAKLKRDKPAGVSIEGLEDNMKKCPHCGAEGEGEKCPACHRSLDATVIAQELAQALNKITEVEAAKATLEASVAELKSEAEKTKVALDAANQEKKAAEEKAATLKAGVRKSALLAFVDEAGWEAQKDEVCDMSDKQFDFMLGALDKAAAKPKRQGPGLVLGNDKNHKDPQAKEPLEL